MCPRLMKERMSASSISRPRGSPLSPFGDHLPGGARIDQLALEPGDLLGAEEIGGGAVAGLKTLRIGAAVAAHVEHEHIEQWTVGYFAIDAARLGRLLDHWQIFAHGAVGARAEEERGLLVIVPAPVLGAGERLARPPIVEHTSWSSHCETVGISALNASRFLSSR